jgi:hypothetical protein
MSVIDGQASATAVGNNLDPEHAALLLCGRCGDDQHLGEADPSQNH